MNDDKQNRPPRSIVPNLSTRRTALFITALLAALATLTSVAAQHESTLTSAGSQAAAVDWKAVEAALGKAGAMQPGDV